MNYNMGNSSNPISDLPFHLRIYLSSTTDLIHSKVLTIGVNDNLLLYRMNGISYPNSLLFSVNYLVDPLKVDTNITYYNAANVSIATQQHYYSFDVSSRRISESTPTKSY